MSMKLECGTKPEGVVVSMSPFDTDVSFSIPSKSGNVYLEFALLDFLVIAEYVLTNTDLRKDDPRLLFIKTLKGAKIVKGFNKGKKRIALGRTKPYIDCTQPKGV
jgi:hypothetical protein